MTNAIVWEDPPEKKSPQASQWVAFADELRAHPGKWAVARSGGKTSSSYSSVGTRLRRLGCEATQRVRSDGTYVLYARWPTGDDRG